MTVPADASPTTQSRGSSAGPRARSGSAASEVEAVHGEATSAAPAFADLRALDGPPEDAQPCHPESAQGDAAATRRRSRSQLEETQQAAPVRPERQHLEARVQQAPQVDLLALESAWIAEGEGEEEEVVAMAEGLCS